MPARHVAEAFGYSVGWDPNTRTVSIKLTVETPSPGEEVEPIPEDPEDSFKVTWGDAFQITDGDAISLAQAGLNYGAALHV